MLAEPIPSRSWRDGTSENRAMEMTIVTSIAIEVAYTCKYQQADFHYVPTACRLPQPRMLSRILACMSTSRALEEI